MSGSLALLRRLGSKAKTSLAVVGLGTTLYAAKEAKEYNDIYLKPNKIQEGGEEKQILVLPFHRMKIVEQKKQTFSLSSFTAKLSDPDSGILEVEVRELVDIIHAAAEDPNIVALHGTFGHGFGFQCGGYAHVEEIRNAIRVFNESHRRHYEPDDIGRHEDNEEKKAPICEYQASTKYSYAYADTFDNPMDSGNKEYFIASAFSQIHMQARGNLNLFGVSMSNVFLADALKKYGLNVHIFKHGQFKNAPNSLTETGYTNCHFENTRAILDSINETIYSAISQSRSLPRGFNNSVWRNIHDYGTMTADNAREIRFVDHIPSINPIFDLVDMNKVEDEKKSDTLREKWKDLLQFHHFQADRQISLAKYSKLLQKKTQWNERRSKFYRKVKDLASGSTASETVLRLLGYEAPYFWWDNAEVDNILGKSTQEKVAVVHVTGAINDKVAKSVTKSLREVKKDKDIKCIVLRVDSPGGSVTASETILEQFKDVGLPVVCSFSNLAASGGYYISAFSDKIYAQKTTLTGSIGVFGVKIDATEAAKQYGVNSDIVKAGRHAGTYSLLQPLNHSMKANLMRNMDRVYLYFKQLVSEGRQMTMEEAESVAQGRVWTGSEAKEVNLIDDFGGIQNAIAFATSQYTSGGLVEVETFPKPKMNPFLALSCADNANLTGAGSVLRILHTALNDSIPNFIKPTSMLLSMDETTAMETIIGDAFLHAQTNSKQ